MPFGPVVVAGMVYPVVEVRPEWRPDSEPMGSKTKFWFRRPDGRDWLFKYPRPSTGEHWAEKIAAEVASLLGISHAKVELARFRNDRGSVAESFARGGRALHHGNELLEASVRGYDPGGSFRQSGHTLENVWKAVDGAFVKPEAAQRAKRALAEYALLDAVIGNTDRHHENWGVLRRRTGAGWRQMIAPSFDHASSLGRELQDARRERILTEERIDVYAERARGATHWSENEARAPSPLELVRRAARRHPGLFKAALARLDAFRDDSIHAIVGRVPDGWMSPAARSFAVALVLYNVKRLREFAR